jgi:membrane-associated tyrosine/threonine-specific cdc2-inhibitory kinase
LGLTILEIALNIILPQNGPSWEKLRKGDFSECNFQGVPVPLFDMIRSMLSPDAANRPSAKNILEHPLFAKLDVELQNSPQLHQSLLL